MQSVEHLLSISLNRYQAGMGVNNDREDLEESDSEVGFNGTKQSRNLITFHGSQIFHFAI